MRSRFPVSLAFFAVTAVFFLLQLIPVTGIFLMFALAMFWSVVLVNAGMIGVAVEAVLGRVPRWWLLLPLVFYGGYWAVAAHDHMMLRSLSAAYGAANARVEIPLDPNRQSLAFDDGGTGARLTQNYALPVAYSANSNFPEGYLSHRMMETAICTKVRQSSALQAAFVHAYGFHDGDAIRTRRRSVSVHCRCPSGRSFLSCASPGARKRCSRVGCLSRASRRRSQRRTGRASSFLGA